MADPDKMSDRVTLLRYVLKDNVSAISLCILLGDVARIWDNLVDGDKPVSEDELHNVFWMLLVDLPENQFFRQYIDELRPIIRQIVIDYLDSEKLKYSSNPSHIQVSYVLRDTLHNIITHCAYLIGGKAWLDEVSLEIRKFAYAESMEQFIEEVRN